MARSYKHNARSAVRLAALFAAGLFACARIAYAGPEGGITTGGSATIATNGLNTTITQTTDRAVIRWDQFDVAQPESVRFNQPSATSITVNRIRDTKPSQIDGSISANGQVVLINPNGVMFGRNATVDVNGIVATSSDMSNDAAFMAGGALTLDKAGKPDARIVNEGRITVGQAGLVGLVAPHVENHGIIQAKLGKVVMASGDIATIDMAGDDLIKLEASDALVAQSVKNTGSIAADGGTVLITAAQARGAVDALILQSGTVRADSLGSKTGSIRIAANGINAVATRKNAQVTISGTLQARGNDAGEKGGSITVTSDRITLANSAVVDASGHSGGGTVRIGGAYQGGAGLPTASRTQVNHGAIIRANATQSGHGGTAIVWSDDVTQFAGHADVSGGAAGGKGGLVEVSGKDYLDFRGTVNLRGINGNGALLLDPTNITISTAANSNVNGATPFSPTVDNATSILNASTLLAALASGDVIVQTRATGSQNGDITVSAPLSWTSGSALTLQAHNLITIGAAINAGANGSLTLDAADVAINAALAGTGTLTFRPRTDLIALGIGAGAVGGYNLNATELANLTNGWGNIVFGRTTSSAATDIRATTWVDNLTLQSGSGTITTNGIVNVGANNLSIITDGDIDLLNALSGTGTLSISPSSVGTAIGLGNAQAGSINLTTTEIGRLTNGWSNLVFGRADGAGDMNLAVLTWNDFLTLQTGSGAISINGTQTMGANNLTIRTDANPIIGGALVGTGALSVVQSGVGTSMGLGTGQAGTLQLDDAELAAITNGWASLTFGRADGTGAMNVGAATWNDVLTLQTGVGALNINGAQTMAANNLTLSTDANLLLGGALTGTGALTIMQSSPATSIGLGDGEVGTLHLDDAELDNITNGWTSILLGRTDASGTMNLGTRTWTDPLTLRSGAGVISVNGTQTMGANALAINTDGDVALNANLSGTSSFALTPVTASTSMGLGDGQAGTINLDNAELARVLNGFSSVIFGTTTMTGTMNVGAKNWTDPLTLRTGSGQMNINGALNVANNTLLITTDSNLLIGANISGSSMVTIQPSSTTTSIGIGSGQAGMLQLDDAELGRIVNGFSSIVIGTTSITGAMNVGASTWNDPLTLRTAGGLMSINGAITMFGNNLTLSTNSNLAINADISGTGSLIIQPSSNSVSMGVGTGQAGTVQLDDAEIGRIQDGFASRIFGITNMSGALNIGARTWVDSVDLRTGSGALNINGTQNMGSNNLIIRTNTNLTLNNNLVGSGSLTFVGASTGTSIGVAGGAGTLNLDATDLSRVLDGWGLITFGATNTTGAITVGARTWTDSLRFVSNTGVINIAGATNVGSNNLTIMTNVNPTIGAALTGTGVLNVQGAAVGTTLAVGTGQTGAVLVDDTELGRFTDGWSTISFGRTDGTGVINVGARSWSDPLLIQSNTGVININGIQNFAANNFTLSTNANPVLNAAINGTGTFTLQGAATATALSIGGSGTLTTAELANISNGWANLIFGRADSTGTLTVAAANWNDHVTYRTGTGILTIGGAQNMGANNLTIEANSNPVINAALTGSGQLALRGSSTATTMGVGTGQAGIFQLSDAELALLSPGWAGITIGRSDGLGTVNVGTNSWADPTTFIAQGNMVLNGVQTSTRGAGTNLVFVTTGGSFISNAGAAGINPGGGRYLVYSVDSALDTNGGLTPDNIVTNQTYAGYPPGSVVQAGNVFIYSGAVAKILYLSIDDALREYGGALPAFTYTYLGGLQNGDTLAAIIASYLLESPTSSILDNAGTTRAITGNFTLNNGYTVNITNGTLTTTKATLTVNADDYNRTYGNANPTFTVSYSGFRNGEDETDLATAASASSAANALSNVGDYLITASGGADGNYDFVYAPGTLSVTKAPIVVTAQSTSRQYGASNPTFTFNYTGFRNGQNVSVIDTQATGSTPATLTSNVGTYAINGAGAVDDNYSFTYVAGTLSVTRATLTATADNATRTYGAANPTFTVSYSGFLNGDTAAMIDTGAVATSGAVGTSGVGNYAITTSGAVDNNYSFTYAPGSLSIMRATLTATADNQTRTYGAANPAFTVSYTGFMNGETAGVIDTGAVASSAAIGTTNVGNYAITASGAADDNYTFVYAPGTLSITRATLTATADDKTRTYGAANPALTFSYSGFVNGETAGVIDVGAVGATPAVATSGVGNYAITGSGASDNNYTFVYAPGTLSITRATLTATADNQTRTYGAANPAFTVSYTGFMNGETAGVIDTGATAVSGANALSNVGGYAITTSGASDNNYDFVYAPGTLSITRATLTATVSGGSRVYGAANPVLTVSYSGFVNGENDSVIDTFATPGTAANAFSNVGSYATVASGAADNNYSFAYVNGALTITKATLTATAGNGTRTYGALNPAFVVNYTGFVNGDNASVIDVGANASSSATSFSDVGSYAVNASGAFDNNYDFVYTPGTLTITKATLSVSVPNQLRPMGEANPVFTINYSGFVNGEGAGVIDTLATASTDANAGSPAGSYVISAGGASDNNYDFVYGSGTLLVYEGTQPAGDTDIPARTEPQQTRGNSVKQFDQAADRPSILAGDSGDIVIIADADMDPRLASSFLIGMTQELMQSYGSQSTYIRLMPTAQYLETLHPRVKRKVLRNQPVRVYQPQRRDI